MGKRAYSGGGIGCRVPGIRLPLACPSILRPQDALGHVGHERGRDRPDQLDRYMGCSWPRQRRCPNAVVDLAWDLHLVRNDAGFSGMATGESRQPRPRPVGPDDLGRGHRRSGSALDREQALSMAVDQPGGSWQRFGRWAASVQRQAHAAGNVPGGLGAGASPDCAAAPGS